MVHIRQHTMELVIVIIHIHIIKLKIVSLSLLCFGVVVGVRLGVWVVAFKI